MKKYFVIGNPIEHSLSPKLHNYWIKENNLDAVYEKKQISKDDIGGIVEEVKKGKIDGLNVTTPFKTSMVPYLDHGGLIPYDERPPEVYIGTSLEGKSVNTIFKQNNKIYAANTDGSGFRDSLSFLNLKIKNKKIFVLGAGGVVFSIVAALKWNGVSKIYISNRTKSKAEEIKKIHTNNNGKSIIELFDWENLDKNLPEFDIIINTTSLGLNKNDLIKLDYKSIGKNKVFYDLIYNEEGTDFLSKGLELGNSVYNGASMLIFQAARSFLIWHGINPLKEERLAGTISHVFPNFYNHNQTIEQ